MLGFALQLSLTQVCFVFIDVVKLLYVLKLFFSFEGNTTEVAASACNHQGWCSELKMVSYTVRMKVHREI